jgi:hypothetical protein
VNRRHRPRADLAETGHEESNGAGQTAGRSRLPRTAWRRHRRDQPLDRRERRERSLPARLAGGLRPVRYRHAARQESIGGYESPPGGTRPARARHRAAEDAAAYRPTEATVQAPAVRAARAARQQQPPSSDHLGQRRPATPTRPDDRTPVLTIAPGLRSDHGDVRQRVGPMAGHQRSTSCRPVQSPRWQIVASDRCGLPMVAADASPPVVAVADGVPAGICTSSRHDGGASRGRPAVSAVGPRTACAPALCLAGAPTRRRPGQSPRYANVGRADDDAPRGRRTRLFDSKMTFHVEQPGRPRLPGWPRFPRSDTHGHCSGRVCTLSDHAHASDTDRQVGLPIARPVNRPGIGSVPSVFHVERPSGAAPAVPRPRTDLGSLWFTPCPGPNRPRLSRGPFRASEARFRAVWAASDLFAGR